MSISRPVSVLIGLTLSECYTKNDEEIHFTSTCGRKFLMHHEQDCCEHVVIEDICGNLDDLIGNPILMAEESSKESETDDGHETWTFYKFATIKGYVTIRWWGSSNGYYSESVSFEEVAA